MTTLYHNPRCSKSRATLALLVENGVEPDIVNYLDNPPDAAALRDITAMLGCSVRDIVRTGEAVYRELGLADDAPSAPSEDALFDIIAANPRLLERPIVVHDGKAAVGRPPESVLSIL